MRAKLLRTLQRDCLVQPGEGILVGLSGGPDSMALLHLLLQVAPVLRLRVAAAHLDHGMRRESADDAAFVRRLCDDWRVPLVVERRDIPALACRHRRGLEETARDQRRAFLQAAAQRLDCAAIALGHHRDDQAETVLQRLLRGCGSSGLAGMRLRSGSFIRPLLEVSRQAILDYLAAEELPFVEDASNRDPSYTRNRIRHQLLPQLQSFNPRIAEHLARLGWRLTLEEDFWAEEEQRQLQCLARMDADGWWLERPALLALHPALRSRVLRRALEGVRGHLRGVQACHLDALEQLLVGERPEGELNLPEAWAGRRYQRLWLRRAPPPEPEPFCVVIAGPGRYPLPDGRLLEVALSHHPWGEDAGRVEFEAAAVPFPLQVRSFRPGDRFRPDGAPGGKKLKDFFIDAKLAREVRYRLPLVVADEILWLAGLRRCAGRRAIPGRAVLHLSLQSDGGGAA